MSREAAALAGEALPWVTPGRIARTASVLALLVATSLAALEVPYLSGRVVDEAGLLSPDEKARIEQRLEAIEEQRGSQIAVLTIPALEGEVLEDYSLRVAETWKLGREEFDDGALLLVARDDRKMRLEVGYGLEPVLTDAVSRRILDDVMRPRFRAGDFGGGIEEAVLAIDGVLAGDENALPPPSADGEGGLHSDMPWFARVGFFLFFLFIVGIFSFTAVFSEGCSGWFLYLFLMPFWLAFPLAILGPPVGWVFFPGWVIGFPILRALTAGARKRGKMPGWLGGGAFPRGWTSSGGWGGGGGFSGGGFSGGGGSFGGGGASSSW